MRTKLIKIYVTKRGGSFFIRSTTVKERKFKLKEDKFGKALSKGVSNEKLGKTIREILKDCE